MSDINSASSASLREYGPGESSPSGITPLYWEDTNLRARLTKLPKLDHEWASSAKRHNVTLLIQKNIVISCNLVDKLISHSPGSTTYQSLHNPPTKTWHPLFLASLTAGNTAKLTMEFQSLWPPDQKRHCFCSSRTYRLHSLSTLYREVKLDEITET